MITRKLTKIMRATSLLLVIVLLTPTAIALGQDIERNYYNEGRTAAQLDYMGEPALIGGLASGFALGIIGWGLGYLVVHNKKVKIPAHYTLNLEPNQKIQFEEGYRSYVLAARKSKYHIGAGIGVLAAIIFVASTTENTEG